MRMLSQTERVTRSAHSGRPIRQRLNPCYGYWVTESFLTEEEYELAHTQPEYTGPMHAAERRHIESLQKSCG